MPTGGIRIDPVHYRITDKIAIAAVKAAATAAKVGVEAMAAAGPAETNTAADRSAAIASLVLYEPSESVTAKPTWLQASAH